jgi:hypothetical protein
LRNPNIADPIRGKNTGYGLYGFIVVKSTIASYHDSDEIEPIQRV